MPASTLTTLLASIFPLLFLLLAGTTSASPVQLPSAQDALGSPPLEAPQAQTQRATQTQPPHRRPRGVNGNFDAAENSVGLLLTQAAAQDSEAGEDEGVVQHLWLPLGRKMFTREHPLLPLRPLTARITTLIHTTPALASPEELERIQCDVWTHRNHTYSRGPVAERWKVSFSRGDGLVRFGEEGGRFWLGGKEVESFECF